MVDPCYKLKFFSEAMQQSVTELLTAKVHRKMQCQQLTAKASCLPQRKGPARKLPASSLAWCRKLCLVGYRLQEVPDSCLWHSWRPGSAVPGTAEYTAVGVGVSVVARQRTSLPAGGWCCTTLPQCAGHLCIKEVAAQHSWARVHRPTTPNAAWTCRDIDFHQAQY